jgi:chromosome segregation ATPase
MIRLPSLVAAFSAACLLVPAQAQQTSPAPAKSQAKPPSIVMPKAPAKAAPPKTLGGKAASGKLLTREELRSCLKRLEDSQAGAKELEQRRAALDKEKDELASSGEVLKAERAEVETKLAAVRDWETRMRAHGVEIEAFNQRSKAAEQAPRAEREQIVKSLESDRERLTQARAPLAADEARLVPAYQNAVKAYNERALARDGLVADWNERNKALNEAALKQEEQRSAWVAECANRPYLEDDEIAIKRGQ